MAAYAAWTWHWLLTRHGRANLEPVSFARGYASASQFDGSLTTPGIQEYEGGCRLAMHRQKMISIIFFQIARICRNSSRASRSEYQQVTWSWSMSQPALFRIFMA